VATAVPTARPMGRPEAADGPGSGEFRSVLANNRVDFQPMTYIEAYYDDRAISTETSPKKTKSIGVPVMEAELVQPSPDFDVDARRPAHDAPVHMQSGALHPESARSNLLEFGTMPHGMPSHA